MPDPTTARQCVVEELDGGLLIVLRIDLQHAQAGAVVDSAAKLRNALWLRVSSSRLRLR
jgi:hypothetical protein